MQILGSTLQAAAFLGSVICFILVVVKMFQNNHTVLGIVCIVLACCFLLGFLIAYVYGWMKSGQWNLRNVMLIWTVCIIVGLLGGYLSPINIPMPAGQ
jgi:ABC-type uncharacterized transport system permease subunit